MDSARDRFTGKPVYAEDLWKMRPVDKSRFVCRGCDIPMRPCSYEPENVIRPYFAAPRGVEHVNCGVDGDSSLRERAKTTRVSTAQGSFPGGYPNRLEFKDERPVVDPTVSAGDPRPVSSQTRSRTADASERNSNRPFAASTLRPICKQFVEAPCDRHLALSIPGVYGQTFDKIFWQLRGIRAFNRKGLFFAPLRWTQAVINDDHLEVLLDAGDRDERKALIRPYRARMRWSGWQEGQRTAVKREVDVARQEAISAHQNKQAEKAWFFFVGEQDPADHTLFYIDDHRLVCTLFTIMTYPPREPLSGIA